MNRRGIAVVGLLALLVTGVLLGTTGTLAAWTDRATVTSGDRAFSSGRVAAPEVTAVQTPQGHRASVSWAATAVGAGGATATGYEVRRYSAATGGSGALVCSTAGDTSCVDPTSPTTTVHYGVRATFAQWSQDSVRIPFRPDREAPTVGIRAPTDRLSAAQAIVVGHVALHCGTAPAVIACGTVSEESAEVSYSLRRTRVFRPFGVPVTFYYCWDGSGYGSAVSAGTRCPLVAADVAGGRWQALGNGWDAYVYSLAAENSYELSVVATDQFSNASPIVVHRLSS